MTFSQSFKFLCLFLALGISIVAAQLYPEFGPEITGLILSYHYCNSRASEWEVCPDIYEPVCADYYGPSYSISDTDLVDYYADDAVHRKTYPNACSACQDIGVSGYRDGGPCEEDCEEDCEEEEEWERDNEEFEYY